MTKKVYKVNFKEFFRGVFMYLVMAIGGILVIALFTSKRGLDLELLGALGIVVAIATLLIWLMKPLMRLWSITLTDKEITGRSYMGFKRTLIRGEIKKIERQYHQGTTWHRVSDLQGKNIIIYDSTEDLYELLGLIKPRKRRGERH